MKRKRIKLDILDCLARSAAGLYLSGSSGCGKSEFMRLMINSLSHTGQAIFCLDPAGDLVADVQRDLATASPSVRDRIVVLKPCDLARGLASPNPLAVPDDLDQLRHDAKLATKVKHMASILLNAWGETDFNSKPLMFKWVTLFLHILALARLPFSAVRYFFDPTHRVYKALGRIAPDFATQMEMEDLAQMRPRDRAEFIASSVNRCHGLLANPAIEKNLSITENAIDVRDLIRQRKIVLVSLETGDGVFDKSDIEILANIYLMEIVFAISNIPRDERKCLTVFCDELPVFSSSFPLLEAFLPLTRKYLARWVLSAQGAYVFPNGPDDSLLNLALGQCGTHVIFGHGNWKDCDFFAHQVGAKHFDSMRRKHTQKSPSQIQVGREIVELFDESTNWSVAEQEGGAHGLSDTSTSTATEQTGWTEQVPAALGGAASKGRSKREGHSTADADGHTSTNSNNWSNSKTQGGSRTKKQSIQPILETHYIEHITFMSPEEQHLELAADIAEYPPGRCILRRRGIATAEVQLPLMQSTWKLTPKYTAKKLAELEQQVCALPIFQSVDEIDRRNDQYLARLVQHLESQRQGSLPIEQKPHLNQSDEVGF